MTAVDLIREIAFDRDVVKCSDNNNSESAPRRPRGPYREVQVAGLKFCCTALPFGLPGKQNSRGEGGLGTTVFFDSIPGMSRSLS